MFGELSKGLKILESSTTHTLSFYKEDIRSNFFFNLKYLPTFTRCILFSKREGIFSGYWVTFYVYQEIFCVLYVDKGIPGLTS